MAQGTSPNRTFLVIGGLVAVVIVAGIIMLTGRSADTPTTAEQPRTETPAAPPAPAPSPPPTK